MISAVIVTYNSAACVGRCIASVQDALPDAEVVVVDNDSDDDTLNIVGAAAPEARVIASGENVGFGRACNAGAEASRGSHLLFLNPDAVVAAVDEQQFRQLLATRPFGLVAPMLEEEADRQRSENSWASEFFVHTFGPLRPREWRQHPRRWSHSANRSWVSGALLLVSRREFLKLGGFDPRFFLYYEDRDLSHRYRNANLPIRTSDSLRGRHTVGTSSTIDGLSTGTMLWSFLGWIQYLCIHEGERAASRAARTTLRTLRLLHFGVHVLSALQWRRATRKAAQLDELLGLLADHASRNDVRFCPDALRLVREFA